MKNLNIILRYVVIIWLSMIVGGQIAIKETNDRYFEKLAKLPTKDCYDWRDLETIFNL